MDPAVANNERKRRRQRIPCTGTWPRLENGVDALIKKARLSSTGAWGKQGAAHDLHKKKENGEEQTGTRLSRFWNPERENETGYARSDQDALLTVGDLIGSEPENVNKIFQIQRKGRLNIIQQDAKLSLSIKIHTIFL
jgi:hypothetical protein